MFRSGSFVAEHVSPVEEDQVQPNGVDLTLEAVYEPLEPGRIGHRSKEVGERQEMEVEEIGEHVPDTYYLPRSGYVVAYGETVAIPEGHVGFIYPRSTLLRNACMLNTAVWDAGYEGRGEGFLQVFQDIQIARGARIGQLVLARADHEDTYDGDYQGEGLGDEGMDDEGIDGEGQDGEATDGEGRNDEATDGEGLDGDAGS